MFEFVPTSSTSSCLIFDKHNVKNYLIKSLNMNREKK